MDDGREILIELKAELAIKEDFLARHGTLRYLDALPTEIHFAIFDTFSIVQLTTVYRLSRSCREFVERYIIYQMRHDKTYSDLLATEMMWTPGGLLTMEQLLTGGEAMSYAVGMFLLKSDHNNLMHTEHGYGHVPITVKKTLSLRTWKIIGIEIRTSVKPGTNYFVRYDTHYVASYFKVVPGAFMRKLTPFGSHKEFFSDGLSWLHHVGALAGLLRTGQLPILTPDEFARQKHNSKLIDNYRKKYEGAW